MRFIQSFSTSGAVQEAVIENRLGKPYVAYIEDENIIDWNTKAPLPPEPIYSAMPLTFEIISGGTITWKRGGSAALPAFAAPARTIEYSINDGEWISITSDFAGVSFNINSGDIVKFRGNNSAYGSFMNKGNNLHVDGIFKIYGNLYSLNSSTGYTSLTSSTGDGALKQMFANNTGLTEVTDISFGNNNPSNMNGYCIQELFANCTNLNYVKTPLVYNYSAIGNIFSNWMSGVSETGTFVKHPNMTAWLTGANGIPDGWTVIDAS